MNQILNVKEIKNDNNKGHRKAKAASNYYKKPKEFNGNVAQLFKIIRFFAIALIIFGVFNIGTGSYAIIKNQHELANKPVKPEITITQISETEAQITVVGRKPINEVSYNWNGTSDTKISGNGRTEVTETIQIISGENTLNVRATDTTGQVEAVSQLLSRKANIKIDIEDASPNAKITVQGENEIKYITLRWNNDQETKVDVNATTYEQEIPIIVGDNTLTVSAVDANDEKETVSEELTGVETAQKPTLQLTTDGVSNYVITANDESGLARLEYKVNGIAANPIELNNEKQYQATAPIEYGTDGRSTIEVTVYNTNGQSESTSGYINPR